MVLPNSPRVYVHGTGSVDQFGYVATVKRARSRTASGSFSTRRANEWTLSQNGKPDPKAKEALTFMKAAPKDQPAIG